MFFFMLMLGATPDRPPVEVASSATRVQAMASVRILRAEVIDFEAPVDRRGVQVASDGRNIFQLAPIRSTGEIESKDGRMVRLQEFH
ncbi:MAG: hypothetical protein V7679_01900 [Parasphingorhabdus sp.]